MATCSTNWKNVNNWHWVEKDCTSWAQVYLERALQGLASSSEDMQIKVKRMDSAQGDVNISQRKGKVVYFFDLKLTCRWKGKLYLHIFPAKTLTGEPRECSGTFVIPEFSHEIDSPQGLSFQVEVDGDSCGSASLFKPQVSKMLQEPFFNLLQRFGEDLKKSQGPTVQIPKSDTTTKPTTPLASQLSFSSHASPTNSCSFKTIEQNVEFMASPEDLNDALTNLERIKIWSRSPVKALSGECSGMFSMFDGNVVFTFENVLKSEGRVEIEMKWRFSSWPEGHFSNVFIEISEDQKRVSNLKLTQRGVPLEDFERTFQNWHEFYWNSIKRVFGY